jgi:hypothetical protein
MERRERLQAIRCSVICGHRNLAEVQFVALATIAETPQFATQKQSAKYLSFHYVNSTFPNTLLQ